MICEGGSEMVIAPAGYDSYNWYDSSGNQISQSDEVKLTEAGEYKIVVTQGVCSAEALINVTEISALPDALANYSITVCA